MMKIGIINYQFSDRNYGAVLQAAALQWVIENKLKLKSEHINYIPKTIKLSFLNRIKYKLGNILRALKLKKDIIRYSDFNNSYIFEEFREMYLPRTKKSFTSFAELNSEHFDFTHVIVGSDQVWRPSYTEKSTLVYFLDFLPSNIKRISYAASFGNDYWELDVDTQEHKDVIKALNKFSSISVREDSGVNICKNIFNKDAVHVLDPTLLAGEEFFNTIVENGKNYDNDNDKGIVFYKLEIDDKFNSFVSELELLTGEESENIYYNKINNKYYYFTVDEWLRKIKNSNLVITDSFHCVCFSILFEKDFIYYPNDNRGLTRLNSLLKLLGLENRIFNSNKDDYLNDIDYSQVKLKLLELRKSSMKFLCESLK
ncbi:TPA: polysaccharide pyruvyl transferase family protein [Photobacterium damselae]